MKMIHTADWHLCARLGRHNRTEDLQCRVERVAAYCEEHQVDVLAIAGDLFDSFDIRPDEMAEALEHVNRTFRPFLARGGTILAVTGNHDVDSRINLVRAGMSLVGTTIGVGEEFTPGRMYLLNRCFFGTLRNAADERVQFVLVPYPFAHRYDLPSGFRTREELNTQLQARVAAWVQAVPSHARFNPQLPTVLIAHLHLVGSEVRSLYRITPREDVMIAPGFLPATWAYAALGHIHQPQHLPGLPNVRYSGPLDRLDFGEITDDRGVWLVDVGPTELRGEPVWLPLDATPMLDLTITSPEELEAAVNHSLCESAFARVTITVPDLSRDEVTRLLRRAWPRLHEIRWPETEAITAGRAAESAQTYCTANISETVHSYLEQQLPPDAPDRQALFDLADRYLSEEVNS